MGAGIDGAPGVETGGLLRTDGETIYENVGPRRDECRDNVIFARLRRIGDDECSLFWEVVHVFGNAVEDAAHLHGHAEVGHIFKKNRRIVGPRKYCLRDVFSNLALIDVERSDHLDVGRLVLTDFPVDEAIGGVLALAVVVVDALDQRTGAIPNANYCDTNFFHCLSRLRSGWPIGIRGVPISQISSRDFMPDTAGRLER